LGAPYAGNSNGELKRSKLSRPSDLGFASISPVNTSLDFLNPECSMAGYLAQQIPLIYIPG
jgi:hypothetical protein